MKVKENFLNEKKTNREKLIWSFDLTISLETRSYFCTAQEVRQSWQFILHFYEKKQVPNMQSHIRNFFSKANLSNSPGSDIPCSPLSQSVPVAITKHHRLGDSYTEETYFSQFRRLRSSKSRHQHSGEGPLPSLQLCLHAVEGARAFCTVYFIKTLIPFIKAPPS